MKVTRTRSKRRNSSAATTTTALLTVADLATRSKISIFTWRSWLKARRLPVVRLGRGIRVTEADYEAFIARHRSR